ncbi:MAG: PilZ domain-containing protein [Myxococcales bacterium]|nr:PilZ domain-containing protein [Myxococcales bacterium]
MDPTKPTRSANPADRRAHARAPYTGTLQLQCAGEGTWFDVQALDVSAGGFSFASASELQRGERLTVAVPALEAYTVSAVVRHVKPSSIGFIVGIEFDEPLPPELERCLGV